MNFQLSKTIISLLSIVISLLFWQTPSFASDLFREYGLKLDGELQFYHVEDLNADGLKDIVLSVSPKDGEEQWLTVYFQTEQGFSQNPNQRFQAGGELILFDFGDVVGDAKKELVFITRGGIYYYSLAEKRYALQAKKLLSADTMFMLASHDRLAKWDFVRDLTGDGVDEILLPQIRTTEIYFREQQQWRQNEIPMPAEATVTGHFDPRFSVGNKAHALYSTPYLTSEDFNGDDKPDLLAVYSDSLAIYCQGEDGFFAECHPHIPLDFGEIWRGQKVNRNRLGDKNERTYLMRIIDVNADDLVDVVSMYVSTKESFINPENEIRIYYGKVDSANSARHLFFSEEPDEVIGPGGMQLVLDILDLNRDGKVDIMAPVVKVGLTNLVRMLLSKSVEIQLEAYLMSDTGYPDKPDVKNSLVITFDYRGGATSPVYEIDDFNGDGLLDVLSSREEKQLLVFWGESDDIFDSSAGARYNVFLPQDGELVRAMHLNRDDKCDLIIDYGRENLPREELKNTVRVLLAE